MVLNTSGHSALTRRGDRKGRIHPMNALRVAKTYTMTVEILAMYLPGLSSNPVSELLVVQSNGHLQIGELQESINLAL